MCKGDNILNMYISMLKLERAELSVRLLINVHIFKESEGLFGSKVLGGGCWITI